MKDYIDYEKWFPTRLVQLRNEKGVSARDMSLSIGQSESYINKIETGKTLPSMSGFFFICDFLEITPQEFFDTFNSSPSKLKEMIHASRNLSYHQIQHLIDIINDISPGNYDNTTIPL